MPIGIMALWHFENKRTEHHRDPEDSDYFPDFILIYLIDATLTSPPLVSSLHRLMDKE